MTTVIFKVGGMVCDGCATNVDRTIAGIPGILNCRVNYASEQAMVQYDPNQVGIPAIQSEVEDMGFTLLRL
ncbi:MAG: heavy-metal-associated domain-containing protein [Elainellaceae cyanobacterium]